MNYSFNGSNLKKTSDHIQQLAEEMAKSIISSLDYKERFEVVREIKNILIENTIEAVKCLEEEIKQKHEQAIILNELANS